MELQGKWALVTGSTGTIGNRIVHRLISEGMRVRALVRRPDQAAELTALGVEVVQGDITDPDAVRTAMDGAQLVVHSAAYIGGDWDLSRRTNVEGTQNMVVAALQARPELFVHISTISVYDLYHQTEFAESSPFCTHPENAYQATKTEAERAVWQAAEQGLPVLVIRPCNVLSAHPTSYWGPIALKRVAEGFHRWHPDGLFPWIHVENLVDLTLLAMHTPEAVGQAYTAIDGHVPNSEYWGRLAAWTGNTRPPEGPPFYWRFSLEKNRSLGYRSRITFDEAMAELEACARAMGYPGQGEA